MTTDNNNNARMYARSHSFGHVCVFFEIGDRSFSIAFDDNAGASPYGYMTRNSLCLEDGSYLEWVSSHTFLENLASYFGYRLVPLDSVSEVDR